VSGLERSDPLPAGRYWIDLFPSEGKQDAERCRWDCEKKSLLLGPMFYAACLLTCADPDTLPDGRDLFGEWVNANTATVKVLKHEDYPGPGVLDADAYRPARRWMLFEVSAPTAWGMATRIGSPSIVAPGEGVETSDDTADKPPLEGGPCDPGGSLDWLCGEDASVPWVPIGIVTAAIVVGALAYRGARR
jgi:hypothetical protein